MRVTITGLDKIIAAISIVPDIAKKNNRIALKEGLLIVEEYSSTHHRYKSRTGNADSAYKTTVDSSGMSGVIKLDSTKKAPYILALHNGQKRHPIGAKNKKSLRWVSKGSGKNGKDGFSYAKLVMHPGTKPDPFLYESAEHNASKVVEILNSAMKRTLREAGLK